MSVMRRFACMAAVLALGLLAGGCDETPRIDDQAAVLIDQYFQALKSGDIEKAMAMYPENVQVQWNLFLKQADVERGVIKQYNIKSIEPSTVYSGKYYIATVHVTGRKADSTFNTESTEIVTAFRKLSEDQTYIVSHKIKSVH